MAVFSVVCLTPGPRRRRPLASPHSSAAYLVLYTGAHDAPRHDDAAAAATRAKAPLNERMGPDVPGLRGHGMTFTIGRGNEVRPRHGPGPGPGSLAGRAGR